MIELALFSFTTGRPAVSALIGTRWYPFDVPAKAILPYVRAIRRPGSRTRTIGGPTGMVRALFDLEINAPTYAGAKAVKEAIRRALDGYDLSRGPMGSAPNDVVVHSVEVLDEEDDGNDPRKVNIVRLPIVVWHEEPIGE